MPPVTESPCVSKRIYCKILTSQLNLDLNYKFLKFNIIATQAIKSKALYSSCGFDDSFHWQ